MLFSMFGRSDVVECVDCALHLRTVPWILFKSILSESKEVRKEMFSLTTHSTHFIYGYMASDIW